MLSSFPGRILPNLVADALGPLNIIIPMTALCSILAFAWIGISPGSVGGLVVFAVLYGFASGSYVSLVPPVVVSTAGSMKDLGTRMGMALAIASFGLIVGNPVAGAILAGEGRYTGLQAFCGVTLVLSAVLLAGVRIVKAGVKVRAKV